MLEEALFWLFGALFIYVALGTAGYASAPPQSRSERKRFWLVTVPWILYIADAIAVIMVHCFV